MGMEEYILVNGGGRWGSVSWMVEEYLVKGVGEGGGECLLDGGGKVDSLPP
jgi:hypothetical protein